VALDRACRSSRRIPAAEAGLQAHRKKVRRRALATRPRVDAVFFVAFPSLRAPDCGAVTTELYLKGWKPKGRRLSRSESARAASDGPMRQRAVGMTYATLAPETDRSSGLLRVLRQRQTRSSATQRCCRTAVWFGDILPVCRRSRGRCFRIASPSPVRPTMSSILPATSAAFGCRPERAW